MYGPFTPVECRGDLEREVVVGVDDVGHEDVAVPQPLPDVGPVGALVGGAHQEEDLGAAAQLGLPPPTRTDELALRGRIHI